MTVLVPWVLWVTAGGMLALVGAHLLSVGTPPTLVLPTTRFVASGDATAVSRARRPQDVWWLLLRLLALLLAGLALSGVQCAPQRIAAARLLVIDADARDTASEWRRVIDSALMSPEPLTGVVWRNGSALVRTEAFDQVFTDSARQLAAHDTLRHDEPSLAGALLLARRLAPIAAAGVDSLALHVLSTLERDATSDALPAVRAGWPGYVQVRVVSMTSGANAREDADRRAAPTRDIEVVRGGADDVVEAAYGVSRDGAARLADAESPSVGAVRIVRDTVGAPLAADDSAHARRGGVLVRWTRASATTRAVSTDSTVASAGVPRVRTGVVARGMALVAPVRETRLTTDGALVAAAPTRQPVAWYLDGDPAVTEERLGDGCIRMVGFEAPDGDLLLTPSARGVLHAIAAPCGTARKPEASERLSQTILEPEVASGKRTALASRSALGGDSAATSSPWLTRALLIGALLLLLIEQWWRRS